LTKLINKFRSEILDTAKPEKVNQYFSNIYQSYYAIGAMVLHSITTTQSIFLNSNEKINSCCADRTHVRFFFRLMRFLKKTT
jgi:cyclopropane fatty-acyl-phospholipid synthase-like methyltransferase